MAPGKVIIAGEHFVVHGSWALAAAIDKGALVEAEGHDDVEVISKALGMRASTTKVPPSLQPVVEAVKATQSYVGSKGGVKVLIDSDLPVSSGLGSSSAVAVATVAATSTALGYRLSRDEIVDLAMIAERITHGRPSGIDPAVATYGGVILFKKGEKPKPVRLKEPVTFILSPSGVERPTSEMVAKFALMGEKKPYLFNSLVSSSSLFTEMAASALVKGDLDLLASILNFFHSTLSWLGVSTEVLDGMVDKAIKAGCIGAKLTGAGGGGYIIALPKYGEAGRVANGMKKLGLEVSIITFPFEGVKVWREGS